MVGTLAAGRSAQRLRGFFATFQSATQRVAEIPGFLAASRGGCHLRFLRGDARAGVKLGVFDFGKKKVMVQIVFPFRVF